MTSQQGLSAVRQDAITWANLEVDLCHHVENICATSQSEANFLYFTWLAWLTVSETSECVRVADKLEGLIMRLAISYYGFQLSGSGNTNEVVNMVEDIL